MLLTLVPRDTYVVAVEAMLSINLGALQSQLYRAEEKRAGRLALLGGKRARKEKKRNRDGEERKRELG